eukprot:GCRY01002531.1.p1 GENE.GCRY01002531.1~~GCRY01002531.1.p1  ORF type:complete len:611 (-),score=174.44 GCRY01002531.1:657-2489(-)
MESVEKPEELTYYLEQVEVEEDSDDDFEYKEIAPEEFEDSEDDTEDTFLATLKTLKQERKEERKASKQSPRAKEQDEGKRVVRRAEKVDDYLRNFLIRMNMTKTLNSFQMEWYELKQSNKLPSDEEETADVYMQNDKLRQELAFVTKESQKWKNLAEEARATYEKLRKERDFHRMHHRRVVQEKNKLLKDLKQLKSHCEKYDPTIAQLKAKYETAMKEKMLVKLDRDKLASKNEMLELTVSRVEQEGGLGLTATAPPEDKETMKKTTTKLPSIGATRTKSMKGVLTGKTMTQRPNDSIMPTQNRPNPFIDEERVPLSLKNARAVHSFAAHELAVSSISIHPRKSVACTTSDDGSWKLWSLSGGELIMTGNGHQSWLSASAFHPKGGQLVTSSGDATVKLWDFASSACVLTFADHTQAVWDVVFHDTGDFVLSASMDETLRLYDINSERCRQILRGHVDSVNCCDFIPFTNSALSGSVDRTVSMWDVRVGTCVQTFYGHTNAVSDVAASLDGLTVASCDSNGLVKVWDARMVAELSSINVAVQANKLAFDPSGTLLGIAAEDCTVKVFDVKQYVHVRDLATGDQPCQDVVFDPEGTFLLSGGSDGKLTTWA